MLFRIKIQHIFSHVLCIHLTPSPLNLFTVILTILSLSYLYWSTGLKGLISGFLSIVLTTDQANQHLNDPPQKCIFILLYKSIFKFVK